MPQRTLAELKTRVKANVTDLEDDALLVDLINEGQEKFVLDTHCNTRMADIPLTAGEDEYDIDTDILHIHEMWHTWSGGTTPPLDRLPLDALLRMKTPTSTVSGGPIQYYAVTGDNMLIVYPPAASGDTLSMTYVPRPTEMAADTDTPSGVPYEFHDAIEFYASWRVAIIDESAASSQGAMFLGLYSKCVKDCKKALRRKGGNRLGPLIPRQYRGYPPHSPSQDIGSLTY